MSNEITTQGKTFALTPKSLDEAMAFAGMMAKSSIVPKDFQGNPGNIIVAIQWGAEIGLAPMQAMQSIAVVNGRPAIWGDAMIALVRGSGLLESITEDISGDEATCTVKRKGEAPTSRTFTMEDAKRAGLSGKQGPWMQYPKRMLQMRARAWALRDVFPDVLRGVYVGEEAQDMPVEKHMGEAEDVTPPPKAASRGDRAREALAKIKAAPTQDAPPAVPAITDATGEITTLLTAISAAPDVATLKTLAAQASHLTSDEDKAVAREAYGRRQAELRATAAPVVDEATGEILGEDDY